ncbi:MAG: nucleotidyltransferase family protein [Granulosicoccus sp.]|nr:nucleotidyltransferase family protein [Granulosicoccus sp.]
MAALVLAAGSSSRFGEGNKLLALRDSRPLLAHVLDAVSCSDVSDVLVVTGHDQARISALCDTVWPAHAVPLLQVHNTGYSSGMAGSLVLGISTLGVAAVDAVLVCLGDMPEAGVDTMNGVITAFRQDPKHALYIPTFKGQRGNPVLIAASLFDSVLMLAGDKGARVLARRFPDSVVEVPCDDAGILFDIDTPVDLQLPLDQ